MLYDTVCILDFCANDCHYSSSDNICPSAKDGFFIFDQQLSKVEILNLEFRNKLQYNLTQFYF